MKAVKYGLAGALALSGLWSLQASAQATNESTIKAEDLQEKNKTPGADVDELITNKKMRAESGSKSKWSVNSELVYQGSTLEKPLAANRPNIDSGTTPTAVALLAGRISGKYSINSQNSVLAGVGVRWITPLEGKTPTGYNRADADNPYLTYQHMYKWSGIQSVFQATPTFYTATDALKRGAVSTLDLVQNNIYEVGSTGLSLGLYTYVSGSIFNKTGPQGVKGTKEYVQDVRRNQSDYGFGIAPFVEYTLNSTLNFRTVFNTWNYEHLRSEGRTFTFRNAWTQSVGLGISVTRDIFLYPNVQFVPENIRADLTNVGLNTYINLF